ncbi:MAG: hypothetical protein M1454_03260 [Candidatus Thermoplasmatota archaeon]|nr:hypothetical protein [Candidatus Thermoplasmatota archaeon]
MPDDKGERSFDELIDTVVIDIKALMLLMEKKSDFYNQIRKKFTESGERDVRLFTEIISKDRELRKGRTIIISTGELLLSAFLILFGISVAIPSLEGINTFNTLVSFYTGTLYYFHGFLSVSVILIVDLILSVLLLIAAFYTIREAAIRIREAGLRETRN